MRRLFITFSIALTLFVGATAPAYAANIPLLDPNFSIVPSQCTACPCGYGGILQLIQNLTNAGVALGVIAMVVVIAYAGASFMLNPTNPEARTKARSMLINVVVGMVILLAAWLVVDFIMKVLYDDTNYGPWNSILAPYDANKGCIKETTVHPIGGIIGDIAGGVVGGTTGGATGGPSTSGGGACAVRTSGPCSVANLTPTFGNAAMTFSKICSNESGGASIGSTVDKTTDGQPVSFGLFQINISANPVAGYNCPAAFTAPYTSKNHNVQIVNQRLYAECKAAALDPATNIKFAGLLFQKSGYSPWLADRKCGFP